MTRQIDAPYFLFLCKKTFPIQSITTFNLFFLLYLYTYTTKLYPNIIIYFQLYLLIINYVNFLQFFLILFYFHFRFVDHQSVLNLTNIKHAFSKINAKIQLAQR